MLIKVTEKKVAVPSSGQETKNHIKRTSKISKTSYIIFSLSKTNFGRLLGNHYVTKITINDQNCSNIKSNLVGSF